MDQARRADRPADESLPAKVQLPHADSAKIFVPPRTSSHHIPNVAVVIPPPSLSGNTYDHVRVERADSYRTSTGWIGAARWSPRYGRCGPLIMSFACVIENFSCIIVPERSADSNHCRAYPLALPPSPSTPPQCMGTALSASRSRNPNTNIFRFEGTILFDIVIDTS